MKPKLLPAQNKQLARNYCNNETNTKNTNLHIVEPEYQVETCECNLKHSL